MSARGDKKHFKQRSLYYNNSIIYIANYMLVTNYVTFIFHICLYFEMKACSKKLEL